MMTSACRRPGRHFPPSAGSSGSCCCFLSLPTQSHSCEASGVDADATTATPRWPGWSWWGSMGGVAATLWGWMLGIAGPTLAAFVVSAVLGAVAGLLAGLAGRQVGERTRARRQANRLVLVARRTALPPAESSTVSVGR